MRNLKQIYKTISVIISVALSIVACNKEIDTPDSNNAPQKDGLKTYSFSLSSEDTKATKSLISPEEEGIAFNWENSDQIGTYSDAGKTEGLNNASGIVNADTNPITFAVSTYVNLAAGSNVYCYYPYSSANDSNNDPSNVTLSIPADQIQIDDEFDSSAMPLVSAPYAISSAIDELDSQNVGDISFYNLGSVIELDVYSSTGAYGNETITGVSLDADKAISGDFSFNLKGVNTVDASTLNISGYTGTSVSVDIAASDDMSGKTNRASAFRAYMVVAPGSSVSGTITVTTDVTTYKYTLPARDFKRATLKKFGLDLEKAGARVKPVSYTYQAVTSAPDDWTGYYVITNTDVDALGDADIDGSQHIATSSISKNLDGTFTLKAKPNELYIEKIDGNKYAIKLSSGNYLGWTSKTTFASSDTKPTSSSNAYLWTITTGASYSAIKNVNDSQRTISYGTSSDFRPYSNPSPVNCKLFKLNDGKEAAGIAYARSNDEITYGEALTPPVLNNIHGLTITCSSDNSDVATVNSTTGEISIIGNAGVVNITVSWDEQTISETTYRAGTAQYVLTVKKATPVVNFSDPTTSVAVGGTVTNVASITPSGLALIYTSSDEDVATVTSEGIVSGVANGKATITATFAGNSNYEAASDYYSITVSDGKSSYTTLSNSNIVAAGTADSGYKSWDLSDENDNSYSAFAIKNQHSNATSDKHYLQIKKYTSGTAYYIQIPTLGTKITSIAMTVSSTSKPMTGGDNTATLFFSSSNSTSATGTGVASGTGTSSVTIDTSSLDLNTGYITASAGVRIWDIEIEYDN